MSEDPQVLLVTGAGSGLGRECALFHAARNYRVFGAVHIESEGVSLLAEAKRRGVPMELVSMDVTQPEQVYSGVRSIIDKTGRIDALVYFAGLGLRGCIEDLTLDDVQKVFDVNVFGVLTLAKGVLPYMRAAGKGRMVITSSVAGRMGSIGIGGYCSSKFAVEGLCECLHQEVAPFGIHVSLLEPGLIQTPHFTINRNRAHGATNPSSPYYQMFLQHEKIVDDVLAKRTFTTEDVARVVYGILQTKTPRLRYMVGFGAKLFVALRRYIPGEIFQRIYWGTIRKMVTKPREQAKKFSSTELDAGH